MSSGSLFDDELERDAQRLADDPSFQHVMDLNLRRAAQADDEDDAAPIIPAAPGWRAALFHDYAFRMVRQEGDLSSAAKASDADLLSVLQIAPILAWVVTGEGMRPATAKGIWTDRTASMLLLAPAGEYPGGLLDDAPDGDVATARTDAELFAWARSQVRLRLRIERMEQAARRGDPPVDFTRDDDEPAAPEITTREITTPRRNHHARNHHARNHHAPRGVFARDPRGRKPAGMGSVEQVSRLIAPLAAGAATLSVRAIASECRRLGIIVRADERDQRRAVRQALAAIPGVRIAGDAITTSMEPAP